MLFSPARVGFSVGVLLYFFLRGVSRTVANSCVVCAWYVREYQTKGVHMLELCLWSLVLFHVVLAVPVAGDGRINVRATGVHATNGDCPMPTRCRRSHGRYTR